MPPISVEYISIGGNRHSAASDWSRSSNLLAFGADSNVALWEPLNDSHKGITQLLGGHKDKVNAVKFLRWNGTRSEILVSGAADGELRHWGFDTQLHRWTSLYSSKGHQGALNAIASLDGSQIFATGGADSTVKVWTVNDNFVKEIISIDLRPRYIPLTLVMGRFDDNETLQSAFLAVGGTRNSVQVHSLSDLTEQPKAELQATLFGHEGWIHSLALQNGSGTESKDFLLASTSHDKYVRLWRFHKDRGLSKGTKSPASDPASFERTLTNKVQTIKTTQGNYSISFEALLLGHEDWVYSAAWSPSAHRQQLLTASADGSLAIWEPEESSGIWVSSSRLGEISGQKGATTATGSAGGFWTGLWSPNGNAVTSVGRTGSWKLWLYDEQAMYWKQSTGISGHVGSVNDLFFNDYLLTTSSDQTTRLHAQWRRGTKRTWHEFTRPQIHGYDLNCVSRVNDRRFVSGADEKLLRVFDEPKDVADMLERLCKIDNTGRSEHSLPAVADIPVLGLSNKAADEEVDAEADGHEIDSADGDGDYVKAKSVRLAIDQPPTEDLLSRHTLWPEHEKLYGHGYEISAAASNGRVLATACKASSIEHAVIRLYNVDDWHEIKPALMAHSLTVTRLAFSGDRLLSVGRDRQWSLFENQLDETWKLVKSMPKAHSRMVLDAAWPPNDSPTFFATGGRDKTVKLWQMPRSGLNSDYACEITLVHKSAVTALSFTSDPTTKLNCLAVGEEDGNISLHILEHTSGASKSLTLVSSIEVGQAYRASKAVTRLAWRNSSHRFDDVELQEEGAASRQLAVAAGDGSVRILNIAWASEASGEHSNGEQ